MRRLLIACTLFAIGCTDVRYLAQAGRGQLAMLVGTRSLDEVIRDPTVPAHVRALLAEVPSMKDFGVKHGLEPTKSYTSYVDLHRRAAVWVVGACAPLAFESKNWTFPIVGSVPYLGWFDEQSAESYANELRSEGWDVDVRPAAAYSTLGWFDDPVLSTMLGRKSDLGTLGDLANVVLHESLHATIYVKGQTRYNENLATFVGDVMAGWWLDEHRGPGSPEKMAYLRDLQAHEDRAVLMFRARARLAALYASNVSDQAKRVEKGLVLAQLRSELRASRPLNNATLMEFASYHAGRRELRALFATCGSDFRRFLRAARRITEDSFQEPNQRDLAPVIRPLLTQACP